MELTIAVTCTVPTACGGLRTVQDVLDVHSTDSAGVDPNLKLVAPGRKPAPVTLTLVPPAASPELGVSEVTMSSSSEAIESSSRWLRPRRPMRADDTPGSPGRSAIPGAVLS
jgi:hypothetical protein